VGKRWNAIPEPAVSAIWRSQTSESAFSVGMHAFPGGKDSFIHGNATSQSEFGRDNGLTRRLSTYFYRGPRDYYRPNYLKITLNPCLDQGSRFRS